MVALFLQGRPAASVAGTTLLWSVPVRGSELAAVQPVPLRRLAPRAAARRAVRAWECLSRTGVKTTAPAVRQALERQPARDFGQRPRVPRQNWREQRLSQHWPA